MYMYLSIHYKYFGTLKKHFSFPSCFFSCLEFEQMAANERKGERHISPGEVQFLWQLIGDHGNNYKVSYIREEFSMNMHFSNHMVFFL